MRVLTDTVNANQQSSWVRFHHPDLWNLIKGCVYQNSVKPPNPLWLILDQVQVTYGDQQFWELLLLVPKLRNASIRVITAGCYGSLAHPSSSPPLTILPQYRIPLFSEDASTKPNIAFSDHHFQEYIDYVDRKNILSDTIRTQIRHYASSPVSSIGGTAQLHPGVVARLTDSLINEVRCLFADAAVRTYLLDRQMSELSHKAFS